MARSRTLSFFILKGRCDKTLKTSVVEAEKRTNCVSIDSEVCVLPLSSFVLEPDYADIAKEVATYVTTSFTSNPLVGRPAHISFCIPHGCDSCLFYPQWILLFIIIRHLQRIDPLIELFSGYFARLQCGFAQGGSFAFCYLSNFSTCMVTDMRW